MVPSSLVTVVLSAVGYSHSWLSGAGCHHSQCDVRMGSATLALLDKGHLQFPPQSDSSRTFCLAPVKSTFLVL